MVTAFIVSLVYSLINHSCIILQLKHSLAFVNVFQYIKTSYFSKVKR
jgi:hypothetical protein